MMKFGEIFRKPLFARRSFRLLLAGTLFIFPFLTAGADLQSVDSDGDGLPDDWEIGHFGSLSQEFWDDADGDGYSNIQEYNGGSSPAEADSMPGFANSAWPMPGHDPLHTRRSEYSGPRILTQQAVIPHGGELDIVLDHEGNIWVSGGNAIKVYTPAGEQIAEHAGDGEITVAPTLVRDGSFCFVCKGEENSLRCVESDGNLRWRQPLTVEVKESRVVVDSAQNVYLSFDRQASAYSIERGYLVWRRAHGSWGEYTPPITLDNEGNVYVDGGQSGLGAFWPLGDLKWSFPSDWVRGAPAVGIDGKLYFCRGTRLAAVDKQTGLLLWVFKTDNLLSGISIAREGTIVFSSLDSSVYAVAPTGQLNWSYATGGELKAEPTIGSDGTVYIGSSDGFIYAIDPPGTLLSRFKTGGSIVVQPLIDAGGRLIVSSTDGNTYVLAQSAVLPEQVVYMSPKAGAISVPLDSVLKWKPASLASSYDVYLGVNPDPPFVGNTSETSWQPASLERDRFYYWRVDSRNENGATRGEACSFSTPDDADRDGMNDLWELRRLRSMDAEADGDEDADGLSNLDEFLWRADPTKLDTDGDGFHDGEEVSVHGTLPTRADTDRDGLSDREEILTHNTDPLDADSDDDGFEDGEEVSTGADPNNPLSRPPCLFVNGKTGNDSWDGTQPVHTTGNSGPKRTIQAAINAAVFFNRINVAPGTYRENILINSAVTLVGSGSETTIISALGDDSAVTVQGKNISPTIEGFSITGGAGKADGEYRKGGGIHIVSSSLKVSDCLIQRNYLAETGSGGAGIYCKNGSLTISNSIIRDNRVPQYEGGGIYCESSSLTMTSCEVSRNEAWHGAGIYCADSRKVEITNSFIVRNINSGIFIGGEGSPASIINCTVADNTFLSDDREIRLDSSHVPKPFLLTNSIVCGKGDDLYDVEPWEGAVVSHCNIEDGDFAEEITNISSDPRFLDPGHYNYRLQPGSPCIDSGTPEEAPLEDFEGDFRVFPDMGADELADADGDGMQDEWERVNDLDPRDPSDRSEDPDMDRRSNFDEFQHRTLPRDDKSGIKFVDAKYRGIEEGTAQHPFRAIQRAIDAASPGETIIVRPGIYYEQIEMTDGIELVGSGAALTAIDGNNTMAPLITLHNISSLTVSGLTIRNARGKSAAVENVASSPLIQNCIISECHNSSNEGGGIRIWGKGKPTIRDCLFLYCSSKYGGAIYASYHVDVFGCTMRACRSSTGIIYGHGGSTCAIHGCIISENFCYGGEYGNAIIRTGGGPLLISNSLVTSNFGDWAYGINGAEATFINCVIAHNGGLGRLSGCRPTFINCTIASNAGGPVHDPESFYSEASQRNCTLWGNGDDLTGFTSEQVSHCNIGDGDFEGLNGNISADPLFVSPHYANYRITATSPCRDAGSTEGAPEFDFEGDKRSLPDIGADEFVDSDFDGVQDAWESSHGLDPSDGSDEAADPDGDGLNNYGEWVRGTDSEDDQSPRGVIYVDTAQQKSKGDGSFENPYSTIQEGIDAAWYGDAVLVADGTYSGNLRMKHAVDLIGDGAAATVISGGGTETLISCYGMGEGTITGFTFRGGRGTFCRFASPLISDCIFVSNSADNEAAVVCEDKSNPVISRCLLEQAEGTAIQCSNSSPLIRDSVLRRNRSTAILCANNSAPLVANCFIVQNGGNGLTCDDTSSPQIINCTIARNPGGKGVVVEAGGTPSIANAILWGNRESDVEGLTEEMISFSDIGSGEFAGINGNISADPRFVGAPYLNYRLLGDSPCVDAGFAENATTADFEGDERFSPDIGADEFLDSDGDGMQDAWEIANSLHPDDASDAAADPDGDNTTNLREYVLTSDPHDELVPRGTVYVQAGAQPIGADGTLAHPFPSIQKGLDAAWYGDTVRVAEGTYNESITLRQGVAIVGQGTRDTIIATASGQPAVKADIIKGASVRGFRIGNTSGSAVSSEYSSLDIVGCNIMGCRPSAYVDGAVQYTGSEGRIENCSVTDNVVRSSGAIRISGSSVTVERCRVVNNTMTVAGGGITCYGSTVVLVNDIIANNSVKLSGGGVRASSSSVVITNCTIVGNAAGERGGGVYALEEPYPMLFNTIVAGNTDDLYGIPQENVQHCHIGDGDFAGINGNTAGDPLFLTGGYYLTPSSPCVDGGDNSVPNLPVTDIEGYARIINGGKGDIVDMGAIEYNPARPLVLVETPSGFMVNYVEVFFTLYDSQGDACDIVVEYPTDEGDWLPATCADGEAGTTGLDSSPLGYIHTFRWDHAADIGIADHLTARIRITPYDPGKGIASESGDFVLVSDCDQDGLPDFWEKRIVDRYYNDELTKVADVLPDDDFDGDGQSNSKEYAAGTDPVSARSCFRLTAVQRKLTAQYRNFLWITWKVEEHMAYDIFWSDDTFGSDMLWHQVSPVNASDLTDNHDGTMTWVDRGTSDGMKGHPPGSVRRRFYRIRVTPGEGPQP